MHLPPPAHHAFWIASLCHELGWKRARRYWLFLAEVGYRAGPGHWRMIYTPSRWPDRVEA